MKEKTRIVTRSCVLCLISRLPKTLNLRSRNQFRGKLLLSQKLHYFRGSRSSQCFKLPIYPHYSLPRKVLCKKMFWVITNIKKRENRVLYSFSYSLFYLIDFVKTYFTWAYWMLCVIWAWLNTRSDMRQMPRVKIKFYLQNY